MSKESLVYGALMGFIALLPFIYAMIKVGRYAEKVDKLTASISAMRHSYDRDLRCLNNKVDKILLRSYSGQCASGKRKNKR